MIHRQTHGSPGAGQCALSLRRGVQRSLLFFTLMLAAFSPAFGQLTTADIVGTITDTTGAVIPNATIVVTNTGTNEKRTV